MEEREKTRRIFPAAIGGDQGGKIARRQKETENEAGGQKSVVKRSISRKRKEKNPKASLGIRVNLLGEGTARREGKGTADHWKGSCGVEVK